MIVAHEAIKVINQHLRDHNFKPRDADPTDYQFGSDAGLRFKTGTVRGEVTVSVWKFGRMKREPIRIISEEGLVEAKHEIDALIHEFFEARRP